MLWSGQVARIRQTDVMDLLDVSFHAFVLEILPLVPQETRKWFKLLARYALEHEEQEQTKINPFERRLHAFVHVLSSPTTVPIAYRSIVWVFHGFSSWLSFFLRHSKSCVFWTHLSWCRACRPVSAWDTSLTFVEVLNSGFQSDCITHTVDGRNPTPVGRWFIPWFIRVSTIQGGAGLLPSTVFQVM